jgi:hypothetical protein
MPADVFLDALEATIGGARPSKPHACAPIFPLPFMLKQVTTFDVSQASLHFTGKPFLLVDQRVDCLLDH